jgi:D-sedoheptulose 7-phosphate isomerase
MSIKKIQNLFKDSIETKKKILDTDIASTIENMAKLIANSLKKGNKLLLCGNGGSAADAQHLAAELVVRLRSDINRRALPAISLAMDSSAITACANDFSFDMIFERSLEALGKSGDVLLAISTSGNSKNIIKAVERAKTMNIDVCCFLGGNGGQLKGVGDLECVIPSTQTGRVQESHIMLGHALMEEVEDIIIASE